MPLVLSDSHYFFAVGGSECKVNKLFYILHMKRWKFAKICGELLKVLTELDIKTDDWKNLEMYSEFERRKSRGEKISYIVEILAEHYGVSVRHVYRTVKRLDMDIE